MLVRARPSGKLGLRANGPYRFVRYVGANRVTAEIAAGGGRTKVVSVTHLRPMLPERSPRMTRYPIRVRRRALTGLPATRPTPASFSSSLSSGVDSSDLEDEPTSRKRPRANSPLADE